MKTKLNIGDGDRMNNTFKWVLNLGGKTITEVYHINEEDMDKSLSEFMSDVRENIDETIKRVRKNWSNNNDNKRSNN